MRKLLVLSFFASPFFVLAQNYNLHKPGYIITLEGDTLRGYLIEEADSKHSERVQFSLDETGTPFSTYRPNQIYGFYYEYGRSFKSIIAEEDTSRVFAKSVVEGKLNLLIRPFQNSNKFDSYLFIQGQSNAAKLSNPTSKTVKNQGQKHRIRDKTYLSSLASITNTTPETIENQKVKYNVKSLTKYIAEYNRSFEQEIPVLIHQEELIKSHDILVGSMIYSYSSGKDYRLSYYRDKTFIERSTTISKRTGFSYTYYSAPQGEIPFEHGLMHNETHTLSLIPFGFRMQAKRGKIIPYGYAGIGIYLMLDLDDEIQNREIVGTEYGIMTFPTINLGAGIKIKIGSNYLLAEVTPNIEGIFANIGYSFGSKRVKHHLFKKQ